MSSSSIYEQLDLDIRNYELADIERFFRLNPATTYSIDDIQLKETVIRQQLLQSGHINKKFKAGIIEFLDSAKKWLIEAKCEKPPAPTSIPPDFRLDPTPDIPFPTISVSRTQELIKPHPIQPVHTTNGNQYYSGVLNPIESRLKTTNICIDTLFRRNYNASKSTDFTYILPKSINNVVSLKVTSFEFPAVWYSISAAALNNSMTIYLYNMTGFPDASFNLIIPDGNYTQNTFVITLNNIFNLIENGLNFLWCEINDITLATVIRARNFTTDTVSGGPFPYHELSPNYSPDFRFTLDFSVQINGAATNRPIYKNLGWFLGFRQSVYEVGPSNETISFTASEIIPVYYQGYIASESFFGSTLYNYLFIEIDDFQNNFPTDSIISANDAHGNYLGRNVIARITIHSSINTIIIDNAADRIFKKRDYFGPVNLEKLKIRILNRFGEVIDVKQNDYSMTLEVTTVS
jgi:hypothetical protein